MLKILNFILESTESPPRLLCRGCYVAGWFPWEAGSEHRFACREITGECQKLSTYWAVKEATMDRGRSWAEMLSQQRPQLIPRCYYEQAINQLLLEGPKLVITCALFITANKTMQHTRVSSLHVPGTLLRHVSYCTFLNLPQILYIISIQHTRLLRRKRIR